MTKSRILKSTPYKNSPLSSVVIHALASGKGITWLDNIRIPFESENDEQQTQFRPISTNPQPMDWEKDLKQKEWFGDTQGRFPANLLCSDDILNDGIERKTGWTDKDDKVKSIFSSIRLRQTKHYSDLGSYSRYFDLDKWWSTLLERIKHENSNI